MFVYQKTEPGTWTVGYFTDSGEWKPECSCNTAAEAAQRTHWLNGGEDTKDTELGG
ncbi:MAG TPA: hypothetical protein VHP54_00085 [Caproiciproducens sp.]|nr:hypothetical protein [Caproiciproducens sp.]